MPTHSFEVHQVAVAAGVHSWEAEDRANGKRIPLPKGGNDGFADRYPEIEEYLDSEYGIRTSLLFNPSTDEFSHRPGGAHWKFVRQNGTLVVEVDDIHRTVWSFTISY